MTDPLPQAVYSWLRQACPYLQCRLICRRPQRFTIVAQPAAGTEFPLVGNPLYINYIYVYYHPEMGDAIVKLETAHHFQGVRDEETKRWLLCDPQWPVELVAQLRWHHEDKPGNSFWQGILDE